MNPSSTQIEITMFLLGATGKLFFTILKQTIKEIKQ